MPTMTEAEVMAASTWDAMMRGSMPPYAALDRVQDVTDDREQALNMLIEACANEFQNRQPVNMGRYRGMHAKSILVAILLHRFFGAEKLRADSILMERRYERTPNDWIDWLHDLRRAIRLCSELVAEMTATSQVSL